MDKTPLLGLSLVELQDITDELAMPKFTAKQIMQWIYQKNVVEINEMTNISKSMHNWFVHKPYSYVPLHQNKSAHGGQCDSEIV